MVRAMIDRPALANAMKLRHEQARRVLPDRGLPEEIRSGKRPIVKPLCGSHTTTTNRSAGRAMSERMPGCPFYGHRWPERSPLLRVVDGNECGLDFDSHGPCVMEVAQRNVDYFACPVALDRECLLSAAGHVIRFETTSGQPLVLRDWEAAARR